jgi:protein-disulfide isomerase
VPAETKRGGPNPPGSKRAAARRRIEEKRAAEAAARAREARRRRTLIGGIGAAVVVIIALVVVFAVQSHRTSTSASAPVPAHTIGKGLVIPVGQANAPVAVNLYEDLQCPNCKAFEVASGSTLDQLAAQGKVVLHYHPMAFLDSSANQNFSTRALNAAAVVTDAAGDSAFKKFHDLIYAHQTPETGPGMTDAQLISFANQAGATGPQVASAIKDLKYADWVKKVTDQASKDGVTGTPTVIIGGKEVANLSPAGITAAVKAAANG